MDERIAFRNLGTKSCSGTSYGHFPVSVLSINHSGVLCKKGAGRERGMACILFSASGSILSSAGFPVKSAAYPGWQTQLHLEPVKAPAAAGNLPDGRRRRRVRILKRQVDK